LDGVINTSFPFAAIASSQALPFEAIVSNQVQRLTTQEAARCLQPRHHGATGTLAWLLPAKPPWRHRHSPKQTTADHTTMAMSMHPCI